MYIDTDLLIYCKINCFRSFHWIGLVYLIKMDGNLSSYNESVFLFSLLFACKTSPPPNKTLHMPLMGPLLQYNRQGPIGAYSLPPLL